MPSVSVSTVRISLSAGQGVVATLVLLQEMHVLRSNGSRSPLSNLGRRISIIDLYLNYSITCNNEMVVNNVELKSH